MASITYMLRLITIISIFFYLPALRALPKYRDPKYAEILNSFKRRCPDFNKAFCDAYDKREMLLKYTKEATPERYFLQPKLDSLLGMIMRVIHTECKNDGECIARNIEGELGEFMMFAMYPERMYAEKELFIELFRKHGGRCDIDPSAWLEFQKFKRESSKIVATFGPDDQQNKHTHAEQACH